VKFLAATGLPGELESQSAVSDTCVRPTGVEFVRTLLICFYSLISARTPWEKKSKDLYRGLGFRSVKIKSNLT
jgi:hypothetical protein